MIIIIKSEVEMKALGERLGSLLKGGECIELIGDVGAGKTTLTKGIAIGLGITDTVQSPTFTINRTYETSKGLQLNHYDFYRLSDPGIMADELAESVVDPTTIIVLEWGDIVASILPEDHLSITLDSPEETIRTLTLNPTGPISIQLVRQLT